MKEIVALDNGFAVYINEKKYIIIGRLIQFTMDMKELEFSLNSQCNNSKAGCMLCFSSFGVYREAFSKVITVDQRCYLFTIVSCVEDMGTNGKLLSSRLLFRR
jgi:hypothetical protein